MKVVIIGLGSIAYKHINALNQLEENVDFYALRHNQIASKVEGIENIYGLSEIEEIKPNFIILSNPTFAHYETLKSLVNFNIPLFIEKPLFSSVGPNELSLVNEISNKKVPNYVACNLRFHKGVVELKKRIQLKKIEEVNIYCGSYLPNWRPNQNFREVYSANEEMGGGVHIDLIHELDYMYWIFGTPNHSQKTFKSNSSLDISAIDYANYLFEYNKFCTNVVLNYYRKDSKRTCEVITSEGTFTLDLLKNTITFNNEVIYEATQEPREMYIHQMEFFIKNIMNKKVEFNTVEEAYNILNLCY